MGVRKKVDLSAFSESMMQKSLSGFFSSSTVRYDMDGLYVFGWESDKLLETRSGYIYEFEIKVSKGDFKNDFKHKKEKHSLLRSAMSVQECQLSLFGGGKPWEVESAASCDGRDGIVGSNVSHRTNKTSKMPNYFFYAVPEGMIEVDDVPPYAGLVYVNANGLCWTVKKAPLLHGEKYNDAQLNLSEKFYYNMQSAKQVAGNWQRQYDYVQKRLENELAAKKHDRTWEQMEADLKKAEDNVEYYKKRFYQDETDLRLQRMDIRLLRRELLKLVPDFDFGALEREAEVRSGVLHKNE